MAVDNLGSNNVQVEINKDGITITLQDKLAWKIEQSWDEVSSIFISTTEKNLFPSDSDDDNLPITIKSGEIKIGDGNDDKDTSLAEYSKQEHESEVKQAEAWDHWEEIETETGIRYDASTDEVEFPEDKQLTDVFSEFVQFLFENKHVTRSDLPWTTPNARTNYVLNSEPVHADDEKMDAVEVIDGVFFDRKIPRVQRVRHVKRLVEEFVEE